MNRLFLALLLAFPLAVSAQIYKTVDENGNTVFTDKPPAGRSSEKVQLGTTNSAPPPPPVSRPEKAVAAEEKFEISVNIVSPAQDTTIAIGYAGNFSVEAQLTPPLAKGIYAQLLMDGTPIGGPQSHNAWSLNNVFRGSHILTVVLTNAGGDHLAESPPITVHVLRAGL
ncbi:MAG: DUF4124 domain-containing protein [Proteobacteria bacterium]|nr:DUF4124 domain-containing protein [Pseudomonadota bacterium]